jgi:flagellar motility protein MotE (MotC chaperone)
MKNYLIVGVVGLIFLAGGFYVGLRLAPLPAPKKNPVQTASKTPAPTPEAISLETLRKTTEGMMDINQALQAREHDVAAREKRVQEQEEELAAERAALDRSHDKFKDLYSQFQQRLELVDSAEQDQLQRQVVMYNSMDTAQSVDLIRGLDDSTVIRLFSIMDVKPLGKMVSAWKAKYPADAPRLLAVLDGMGRVVPKDKMALPDGASAPDAAAAPAAPVETSAPTDSPATPVADLAAPTAAPDMPASPPAPDPSAPDTSAKADPLSPPADSTTPAATPDSPAPAATDASAPADTHSAEATPPAAVSQDGVATAKNN